jgi:MFS family permease
MSHPYLTLLRTSDVTVRLGAVFVSAITIGMMSLTVVLCVVRWTGSFALAGTAGGLFSLGNAAGVALQGRLLDRARGSVVLGVAGAVCLSAVVGFVAAGSAGAPPAVVLTVVAVAGCAVPALTAAVRAWLPVVLDAETERTASYALLSVVFQAAVAVGPLLVSACVVLAGPELGALVAALLIGIATALYLSRDLSRACTDLPAARSGRARAGRARTGGRAVTSGLLLVLGVAGLTGLGFGSLLVTLPAAMADRGAPAMSGVLFAAIAVGEMCGALAYGARRWSGARSRHLLLCLAVLGVAYATAAAVAPWTASLIPVLVLSGAAGGPVAIVLSALIDDVVADGAVGRAYSLLVGTGLVAIAAGSATAGHLVDPATATQLLAVPAALSLLAAGLVVVGRRSLVRRDAR